MDGDACETQVTRIARFAVGVGKQVRERERVSERGERGGRESGVRERQRRRETQVTRIARFAVGVDKQVRACGWE